MIPLRPPVPVWYIAVRYAVRYQVMHAAWVDPPSHGSTHPLMDPPGIQAAHNSVLTEQRLPDAHDLPRIEFGTNGDERSKVGPTTSPTTWAAEGCGRTGIGG